ncbi:MAG TPA: hypothetical protein VJ044_17620 [Candidatus Hodarchaeales archaeon]|nr:hypothetical protein [Candidatus Hodarchaeales archaeon]
MVLADEAILTMAIYLFTFAFLFALGSKKHPMFYILCGVVGMMFAVELWTLVQSTILTTILSGVSLMIIGFGLITKPEVKE